MSAWYYLCSACSSPVGEADEFCRSCGNQMQSRVQMKGVICPHCDREEPPWAKFCGQCGKLFEGTVPPRAAKEKDPHSTLPRRYQRLELLGRGGMGETYKALNLETKSLVCIKELRPHANPRSLTQECEALKRLAHPGIVSLLELNLEESFPCLVLEYVDGLTLFDVIRSPQELSFDFILAAAIRMFDAIRYAHQKNIIHRDLKPNNVILPVDVPAPQPKILDFGISIVDQFDYDGCETAEGLFGGNPAYVAPEQLDRRKLTPACDVYGLGQILWELVSSKPAFAGGGLAIMRQKGSTDGLELQDSSCPEEFQDFIWQCTRISPVDRPSAEQAFQRLTTLSHQFCGTVIPPCRSPFFRDPTRA